MRIGFFVGIVFFLFCTANAAAASVIINEAFFDPSKSNDTGFEKIELYNNGDAAAAFEGWELYADNAGYFVFPPGFSLPPRGFATVHFRSSGVNDSTNLYHAGVDNMGDSSGSVALFSAVGHPRDSLVDFVRYHKPGAGESKTWESAAVSKGLWEAGAFVDITGLAPGSSIALVQDGVRGSAGSWRTGPATIGLKNDTIVSVPPASRERASSSAPPRAEESLWERQEELATADDKKNSGGSDAIPSEDALAAIRPIGSWGYFAGAFLLSLLGAGGFLFWRSRQSA